VVPLDGKPTAYRRIEIQLAHNIQLMAESRLLSAREETRSRRCAAKEEMPYGSIPVPWGCLTLEPSLLVVLLACSISEDQAGAQPTAPPPAPTAKEATSINFGLGGIVSPDKAYRPLTLEERTAYWAKSNFTSPRSYIRTFGLSIPQHLNREPEEWGGGWGGYFRRSGSRAARFTLASTIEMGGAALIGHDPRYVASRKGERGWKRFGHSLTYTFLTYNNQGKPVFNISHLGGQVASEFAAAQWTPHSNVRRGLIVGLTEQITFGWISNIAKEYAPELKRFLGRKKRTRPAGSPPKN
jgi:hypothetical protein